MKTNETARPLAISRPVGLGALPQRYGPLFDQAVAIFAADERVRALWVHGAMARGAADAGSDLDLSIAVSDDRFEEFCADWETWLGAITPSLTARPISAGSFYVLTPTCERFDVIAEKVSELGATSLRRRIVVFDRDGLDAIIPLPEDPGPDPAAVSYLIEETLRQAANFPVVVVRRDWLLGVVAVQQVHYFLYQLFAEINRPMPPTGPKQWSSKLTADQRRMLESLPVPAPSEDAVRVAREAAFTVFFREAPSIAERAGVTWPAEIEHSVRTYLEREAVPLPVPVS
ncbi:hypothetical protein EV651_11253 [Kribbella sp. VKM Ac-2571]|uniref:hypothetical protein n=1 Tax=Kribbella sp. VKM Ac-2571 TaxID=2512222 RepID=UPI001061B75F|nr:hypothetical protein [Kribbella sp. VKM Ac-2571]TDO56666.1 hypothetical protein EV651_11253 [Kribbella sp. VKM Ac-2571]